VAVAFDLAEDKRAVKFEAMSSTRPPSPVTWPVRTDPVMKDLRLQEKPHLDQFPV
jgi:hypothetical protein